MRKEEVAVQSSKLIRATWPRVRSEQKHGKSGYVVDARGNGWRGKQREWFPTKALAKNKAEQIASDCWSLGFQSAAFKEKDYTTFKAWSSLIEQTCKEFKLPELSLESLIELAREGRKVKTKAALESHVPSVLLATNQYYEEKISTYGGKGRKNAIKGRKAGCQKGEKPPHGSLALENSKRGDTSDGRDLPQNGKATGRQTIKPAIAKNSTDTIQNVFQMVHEPQTQMDH